LLPEQFIPRAVTKLSQTIKDLDSDVTKRNLLKIIQYVENVWIKIVKPSTLSVFKRTDRTNNCVEAFHSQLNKAVGITHPGIWIFLEKLKQINFRYTKEHQNLLEGSSIRTSNLSKKNSKDEKLKKLWEEFPLLSQPCTSPVLDSARSPVLDNISECNSIAINSSISTLEVMEEYHIPEFDGNFSCEGASAELLEEISEFSYQSNFDQKCEICLESVFYTKTSLLTCGHLYHSSCIKKWLKQAKSCPICRHEI
ncbi:E3 ubiquitin-protein ligase, partial [Armadillidium vulgare]